MIYVLVLGLAPFVVQFAIGAPLACREFQSFSRGIQRPEPPSCIELRFNEDNFQACKIEMEQYRSDIEGYKRCLAAESRDAVQEFNSKLDSFNCNARASFC
jgi:hypothetical protein